VLILLLLDSLMAMAARPDLTSARAAPVLPSGRMRDSLIYVNE